MVFERVSAFSVEQKTFAPPLDQIKYATSGLIARQLHKTPLSFLSANRCIGRADYQYKSVDVVPANRDLKSGAYTGIPRMEYHMALPSTIRASRAVPPLKVLTPICISPMHQTLLEVLP